MLACASGACNLGLLAKNPHTLLPDPSYCLFFPGYLQAKQKVFHWSWLAPGSCVTSPVSVPQSLGMPPGVPHPKRWPLLGVKGPREGATIHLAVSVGRLLDISEPISHTSSRPGSCHLGQQHHRVGHTFHAASPTVRQQPSTSRWVHPCPATATQLACS